MRVKIFSNTKHSILLWHRIPFKQTKMKEQFRCCSSPTFLELTNWDFYSGVISCRLTDFCLESFSLKLTQIFRFCDLKMFTQKINTQYIRSLCFSCLAGVRFCWLNCLYDALTVWLNCLPNAPSPWQQHLMSHTPPRKYLEQTIHCVDRICEN